MLPFTAAQYLGLQLNSPIIVGSCSLTRNPETVRELSIAGAGAVVLPSLFEEQIVHQLVESGGPTSEAEAHLPSIDCALSAQKYNGGREEYLDLVASLRRATGISIIANLNGCTAGRWLEIARDLEQAGANAIEVTIDIDPVDASLSADQVENKLIGCISDICNLVDIPISVKLTPYHTNLANLAWRLMEAGAGGLVCFAHESEWVVRADSIGTSITWGLTQASNINPTLSGLIRIRTNGPPISIAASGGISSCEDLVKTVMAGADVGMVTSELYRAGPDAVAHLLEGLSVYLRRHGFTSFTEFVTARPVQTGSIRRMHLAHLTSNELCSGSTPSLSRQHGDRWGHPQ